MGMGDGGDMDTRLMGMGTRLSASYLHHTRCIAAEFYFHRRRKGHGDWGGSLLGAYLTTWGARYPIKGISGNLNISWALLVKRGRASGKKGGGKGLHLDP
jgi:hypothetical protein